MRRFLLIVEKSAGRYTTWSPDVPGCIAVGESIEEAEVQMKAALRLHLEGLEQDALPLPRSTSIAEYILI